MSSPTTTLSEYESKQLLASYGVPVLDERLVDSADAAVDSARAVGGPVVLKLCGRDIAHKTERGLVRLGLTGSDAVRRAALSLLAAVRPEDGPTQLLVAPFVRGTRELIAGLERDAQFGPCVMVGLGGVLAEVLGDVVFRLVPLQQVDADEAIDDLSTQGLLGPFRGEPAVDRAALADVLVGLSRAAEQNPEIVSADVNPLVVVDGKPVAVDALLEVRA